MSKNKYECFRCRDAGFPGTMVYLSGKDAHGKTIYVEDEGLVHQHKTKASQEQQQTSVTSSQQQEPTYVKILNAKLDRIIALLEKQ